MPVTQDRDAGTQENFNLPIRLVTHVVYVLVFVPSLLG